MEDALEAHLRSGGSSFEIAEFIFNWFGEKVPRTAEKKLMEIDRGQREIAARVAKWKSGAVKSYTRSDIPEWVVQSAGEERVDGLILAAGNNPAYGAKEHFAKYDGEWHFDREGYECLAIRSMSEGLLERDEALRWIKEVGMEDD